MPEISGGANPQIVKAVLDNIGRRYLVEHWQSDDGRQWYDRYSDGWVVQGGIVENPELNPQITLPIEFRDLNYNIFAWPKDGQFSGQAYLWNGNQQTTGFYLHMGGSAGSPTTASWEAKGFAA